MFVRRKQEVDDLLADRGTSVATRGQQLSRLAAWTDDSRPAENVSR